MIYGDDVGMIFGFVLLRTNKFSVSGVLAFASCMGVKVKCSG